MRRREHQRLVPREPSEHLGGALDHDAAAHAGEAVESAAKILRRQKAGEGRGHDAPGHAVHALVEAPHDVLDVLAAQKSEPFAFFVLAHVAEASPELAPVTGTPFLGLRRVTGLDASQLLVDDVVQDVLEGVVGAVPRPIQLRLDDAPLDIGHDHGLVGIESPQSVGRIDPFFAQHRPNCPSILR